MTSCQLEAARPDGELYRLGRLPHPWAWPDWAYAGEDGTFGNRYDDPASEFRVLYASSRRIGPFLETLARFRPDPAIAAAGIEADPRDARYPTPAPGRVPARWLEERALGTGRFTQELSRYVYECTTSAEQRAFQSIRYLSRLGDDIVNWAIQEPATIDALRVDEVDRGDPDLRRAVDLFGLTLL